MSESKAHQQQQPETVQASATDPAELPPDNKAELLANNKMGQADDRVDQALGIFADLDKLAVTPEAQVGAREILSTVAVRRPKNNEFIRVDPARSLTSVVFEDRDEGEVYFIAPHIRPMMIAGTAVKLLTLTVNQGGLHLSGPSRASMTQRGETLGMKVHVLPSIGLKSNGSSWLVIALLGNTAFTSPKASCRRRGFQTNRSPSCWRSRSVIG